MNHRKRRTGRKIALWGVGGIVGLSVIGNMIGGGDPTPEEITASGLVTSGAPAPATTAAVLPGALPAGLDGGAASSRAVRVTRVVDGDTFEVVGGDEVRVLGIDSCESSTDAGDDATAAARAVLVGAQVTLRAEPGVDKDRYGRLLRYVDVPRTGDLGEHMVTGSHTAVYEGRNDAAAAYVSRLRSLDGNGRTCDKPDPVPVPAPADDDDRREAATTPDSSSNSDSGSGGGSAYYPNCKAAKAAGAAPLDRRDPGYSRKLDRDGDGTACE